jgi:hypothetical protein
MASSTTSKSTSRKPQSTENQHHIHQNAVLVWIDGTVDPSDSNWQRMLSEMEAVVNTIRVSIHTFRQVLQLHSNNGQNKNTRHQLGLIRSRHRTQVSWPRTS